jgi:hypothetical protein
MQPALVSEESPPNREEVTRKAHGLAVELPEDQGTDQGGPAGVREDSLGPGTSRAFRCDLGLFYDQIGRPMGASWLYEEFRKNYQYAQGGWVDTYPV